MRTTAIDDTVRTLDPAPTGSARRSPRADADLRRILATPRRESAAPTAHSAPRRTHSVPSASRRPTRWHRGLVAIAGCAVLVTAGAVAIDIWRPTPASATWTAVGHSAAVDSPGAQQCATWWQVESSHLEPVLQEQRGDTTLVLASDGQGGELLCTVTLTSGQEPTGGMTSIEDAPATPPAPDGAETVFVFSSFQEAMIQNGWQAEGHTAVTGHVGEDVTRLVLETSAGPVEASLEDGRFAAWWPIQDDSDVHPETDAVVTTADGATRSITLSQRR